MRLYVAILARDWWRKELGGIVLPRIFFTKNVHVGLMNPAKGGWDIPRASNCNAIRKRFLEAKPAYDYLLMIDHDTVPLGNPATMIGEDIVGFPTRTRRKNGDIIWNVYKYIPKEDGYASIELADEQESDLEKVDAVGGGCTLIKRKVLEEIIFEDIFNGDGTRKRGHDIEFCHRAREKGFKVWASKIRCEHFKNTGISGLVDV